jgi:sulfonate transport system substrate-binding protein
VDLVLLPPTDAALAFRSGAVDAWAVWDPYVSLEVQQFGARVLVDGRGLTPAIMAVSAHEDAIRTKRAQLTDFLGRFRAAWAWADQHIPEYARTNAALTGLPEPVLRQTYETERTQPVPLSPGLIAELQAAAENALEFGLLRQRLDVRRAFDTSLDPSNAA